MLRQVDTFFMKIKKGIAWLRRDFEKQLSEALNKNHVVELGSMIEFAGRNEVVADMLIRNDIEYVNLLDLEQQKKIDCKRQQESLAKHNYENELKNEEIEIKKRMGI